MSVNRTDRGHAGPGDQGAGVPQERDTRHPLRIVLGVSGGIAAYKAAYLLRLLRERGHAVRVVPTPTALEFVGRATWEALSGQPVRTDVLEGTTEVDHVRIGREAELVIVAPATADLLARAATGRADDLLTATLLTATAPVLLAPAMHTEMWQHPATVANVATLRARGVTVLDPADGRLTGVDSGPGRLPEPEEIAREALALVRPADGSAPLAGRRVVVSAGGTREPIDPVRFLGNRSSGRQGVALAVEAARRGAAVTLVAANVEEPLRVQAQAAGADVVQVGSAAQLHEAMLATAPGSDVVVMAAAVADFRPRTAQGHKLKKGIDAPEAIELVANPDILRDLVERADEHGALVIGFAAETGTPEEVLEHGRAKARRKGAALLAVNSVGTDHGFGDVGNAVTLLDADGEHIAAYQGSKTDVASGMWTTIAALLDG